MRTLRTLVPLVLLVSGCYDEGLNIRDLTGRVVIPREAVVRTIDGQEVADVRNIGPVYVGVYSGIDAEGGSYPQPEAPLGIAFPYGGTSVGDFRNPCIQDLACKVVTGRYTDFDDLLEWFRDVQDDPPVDNEGGEITTGEYIRQQCFELLEYTSDEEIRLSTDKDGDGEITVADLDFQENADGDFEGRFTLYQQEFVEGMAVWGFMETPQDGAAFSTCNEQLGYQENTYNRNYRTGTHFQDILNEPDRRIEGGDWTTEGYIWTDPDAPAVVNLNWRVGSGPIGGE